MYGYSNPNNRNARNGRDKQPDPLAPPSMIDMNESPGAIRVGGNLEDVSTLGASEADTVYSSRRQRQEELLVTAELVDEHQEAVQLQREREQYASNVIREILRQSQVVVDAEEVVLEPPQEDPIGEEEESVASKDEDRDKEKVADKVCCDSHERRWFRRLSLFGALLCVTGVAIIAAVSLLPSDGGNEETAISSGDFPLNDTSSVPTTSPTSTTIKPTPEETSPPIQTSPPNGTPSVLTPTSPTSATIKPTPEETSPPLQTSPPNNTPSVPATTSPTSATTKPPPRHEPTSAPTSENTSKPSAIRSSRAPSSTPTKQDSPQPTSVPTSNKVDQGTSIPSSPPTSASTIKEPTGIPSQRPTLRGTSEPSTSPTSTVTISPTISPTSPPSSSPTTKPTVWSTSQPPTGQTSQPPTQRQTDQPRIYFGNKIKLQRYVDEYLDYLASVPDPAAVQLTESMGNWDVSGVKDFSHIFSAIRNPNAKLFNHPDVSHWNTSSATTMRWAFKGASAFNQPLNNWNVESVTNMYKMFEMATSFNQDLSSWKTFSLTNIEYMFNGATAFNGPISTLDVSKVTRFSTVFQNAQSFNQDIRDWDVSGATNLNYFLYGAKRYNQPLADWGPKLGNVNNMIATFHQAWAFNQDLCLWGKFLKPSVYFDNPFGGTSCDTVQMPSFAKDPPGPFCHVCE